MQHMPEEIRHLQQRASPQSDRTPHGWQRCPANRRLGTERQQSFPCFSDCTVQYIIDCNRSSQLADKDTAHDTSTDDMFDTISSSPPTKRPCLDPVDFISAFFDFTVIYIYYVLLLVIVSLA